MRRSVGSRGAATSSAAFDARVGGSFIQSAMRSPSTAPSALATSATHATTPTSRTGRDFDDFDDFDPFGDVEPSPGGANDGGSNGEPDPGGDAAGEPVVGGDDGVGADHGDGADIGDIPSCLPIAPNRSDTADRLTPVSQLVVRGTGGPAGPPVRGVLSGRDPA